jgi:hypothetical protein
MRASSFALRGRYAAARVISRAARDRFEARRV